MRLPKPEGEWSLYELQGTVVSSAMDKTIVVKVDTIKAHRKQKKVVRRSTKFHAHDEGNQAKAGDVRPHRGERPASEDEEPATRRDRRGREVIQQELEDLRAAENTGARQLLLVSG